MSYCLLKMLSLCTHSLRYLSRLEFTLWMKCRFKYFEMLVYCLRYVSDFCGVFSNLTSISCNFSSVSTLCFLAGFLFRSDPLDLIFLITTWMPLLLWTVFPGNFL
jgi:hypothetical protein